jgi:hypothetical protein
MRRIVRIVAVVLLALGSHAAAAQESSVDSARALSEARRGVGSYMAAVQARAVELGREIDVLGELTEAADSVSAVATGQSLTRARHKVEEAKATADREPALGEPVPTVVDVVLHMVTTPPFGMPADQLRAKLFVEISQLEEDILRQCQAFQNEAQSVESLEATLARIRGTLHATAIAGGRASLLTRRRALKSGS